MTASQTATVLATSATSSRSLLGPGPAVPWATLGAVAGLLLGLLLVVTWGESWRDVWRGLTLGVRGLVGKELRSRNRGWRPPALLTSYLLGLGIAVVGFLYVAEEATVVIVPTIGAQLFSALSVGAVVLIAFITPALTAGALSGERERRTLDLLLVTRASTLGLVAGKLLGSLLYVMFLLTASLPAFALVYLYGGVLPHYLALVFVVAAATALTHATLGLLLSALFRRTLVALVLSYLIVLALVLGAPIAAGAVAIARQGGPGFGGPGPPQYSPGVARLPAYLYVSPLVALASTLPAGTPGLDLVGLMMAGFVDRGAVQRPPNIPPTYRVYVGSYDPTLGRPALLIDWAPWVYHLGATLAFAAFGTLGSALALMPVKPWHVWRARRTALTDGAPA